MFSAYVWVVVSCPVGCAWDLGDLLFEKKTRGFLTDKFSRVPDSRSFQGKSSHFQKAPRINCLSRDVNWLVKSWEKNGRISYLSIAKSTKPLRAPWEREWKEGSGNVCFPWATTGFARVYLGKLRQESASYVLLFSFNLRTSFMP